MGYQKLIPVRSVLGFLCGNLTTLGQVRSHSRRRWVKKLINATVVTSWSIIDYFVSAERREGSRVAHRLIFLYIDATEARILYHQARA